MPLVSGKACGEHSGTPRSEAATQPPLSATKPESQTNPQLVPSQVAMPCAGVAHGLHALPHEAVLLLLAHCPLHAW